jgi:Transposase DDE domain
MTGPSPVDRGKPGSKVHVLSERTGIPLSVAVPAANTNDAFGLKPLVLAVPAIRSGRGPRRRKPDKLHADAGLGPGTEHHRPDRPQRAWSPVRSWADAGGSSNDRWRTVRLPQTDDSMRT